MAIVTILNPNFTDNGSGFNNWIIGSSASWSASDSFPFFSGTDGFFSAPSATGNTLTQTGVFTDFTASTQHRIKVDVNTVVGPTSVTVLFGTFTAGTITTAGIHYFTSTAITNSNLTFDITSGLIGLNSVIIADVDASLAPYTTYVSPAYNPFYFLNTSIHISQPNFQYVYDIFTGNTGIGLPQARIKLLPRPIINNCVFSPARILESYVSYDLNIQNITASTNSINHITPYTILFGEEYGLLSTGTTIYSGMTFISGYTFNGVQQYNQLPTWKFTDYALSASTSKFLTYQPRSGVFIKNTTDRGTLSFMQNIYAGSSLSATTQEIVVYQYSGGSKTYDFVITGTTGQIVHIPSGIWNLNNNLSGSTIINPSTDYQYTIQIFDLKAAISEALLYKIDTDCSKFQTVRIQFLNRLGGFDYINFTLVSRDYVNSNRKEYKRVLPYNYVVGERGRTVIDIDANKTHLATSDWMNQDTSDWFEELITTNEAYVISSTGVATPIIITVNAQEMKKNINYDTKMINYEITYEDAFKLDTQRG